MVLEEISYFFEYIVDSVLALIVGVKNLQEVLVYIRVKGKAVL